MVGCIIIKNCLSRSGLLVIAHVLPLHVGKGFVQRLVPNGTFQTCIHCFVETAEAKVKTAVIWQGVTVVVITLQVYEWEQNE